MFECPTGNALNLRYKLLQNFAKAYTANLRQLTAGRSNMLLVMHTLTHSKNAL
jgi:hypothetical protein